MNDEQSAAYREGFEAGVVFSESKLEEAKEIIRATIDYLDCDWFPHRSRNGNDRATVRSRARSFLKENGNG